MRMVGSGRIVMKCNFSKLKVIENNENALTNIDMGGGGGVENSQQFRSSIAGRLLLEGRKISTIF